MTKKTAVNTELVWDAFSLRATAQGKPDMDAWATEHGLQKGMGAIIERLIEDPEMTRGKPRAVAVVVAEDTDIDAAIDNEAQPEGGS
jgi:hypothetical protein